MSEGIVTEYTEMCSFCGRQSEEGGRMNTRIDYLYRDASNYKVRNFQMVEGSLSDGKIEEIMSSCDNGNYFIPIQVGLPEKRFSDVTDDDHPWFELLGISPSDEKPTLDLTAEQLYRDFVKASGNWDETLWERGGGD